MNPLLANTQRLVLYLLAWIPLAAMLVYVLVSAGGTGWLETTALVVPLCLVYGLLCLSAWYTCKANPLRSTGTLRLFETHLAAAALISFLWMEAARVVARILSSSTTTFAGLSERFAPRLPILFGAGVLLYLLSVASHYVVLALEESRQAEARALEARVLARDAELKALKAQVNPHFLFNSLNSISALTSVDPARAREMCILLAEFLRMTLNLGAKSTIPLAEELSLLRCFLAIEKVRFGPRLVFEERIQEETNGSLVPPLLLQPLVENAVTHGIAQLPEGGTILIAAGNSQGRLSIVVENSMDPDAPPARRGGMGLANVRQRLEARYGENATITARAEGDRFRVSLSLPAEAGERQA